MIFLSLWRHSVNKNRTAEILSPAGDEERMRMAVAYGANAVYLAGKHFGMRAAAGNFGRDAMAEAVRYCHERGTKVYVTCNTLPREEEIPLLPDYLHFLQDIGADAVIAADFGVFSLIRRETPHMKVHVSTQFGVVNSEAARALYDYGADTVVLARELSLSEIRAIRKNTPEDLRIECFVHGAMCMAFSGRCLLSNYFTGRDSNRGQCAQPCRWSYHIVEETRPGEYYPIIEDNGTHILNSRDLCMIDHVPELLECGVNSLKIEGRMKSFYYTAVVTAAYRHAMDAALAGEPLDPRWRTEVEMVSHRPYTTGFYYGEPDQEYADSSYSSGANVAAVVESCDSGGFAVLTQRNKFHAGDEMELLLPGELPVPFTADALFTREGEPLESTAQAMMVFRMKLPCAAPPLSIIRMKT